MVFVFAEQVFQAQEGPDSLAQRLLEHDFSGLWFHRSKVGKSTLIVTQFTRPRTDAATAEVLFHSLWRPVLHVQGLHLGDGVLGARVIHDDVVGMLESCLSR